MFSPVFGPSLGAGISQTLNQQLTQQGINSQFLNNANANLDLTGRLDFIDSFARQRDLGASPNQAFLNVAQTSLNPANALNGLAQFGAFTQGLAPFAAGAAVNGAPGLLNQLGAPLGIAPQQGVPSNLLQSVSPFFQNGVGQVLQQQANERSQQQTSQLLQQVLAQQQQSADLSSEIARLSDLNRIRTSTDVINDSLGSGTLQLPTVDGSRSNFFNSSAGFGDGFLPIFGQ